MPILSPLRHIAATALALGIALAPLTPALAETATLTVTGTATVEATPDLATLSLGVTTQGDTAAGAMEANSAALTEVIARIKSAGIAPRDIQTSNLALNPNWVSTSSGTGSKIDGYVAANMLTIRIRALGMTGAVLDAAIADGANTLNGLTFGLHEPRPVEDEARRLAVADALARAMLYADSAGVQLGQILSISDGTVAQPMPEQMYRMAADVAMPVEAGALAIAASVTITFKIGN